MAQYYPFCHESGRRDFFNDLQNDSYEMVEELRSRFGRESSGYVSRIRVMFEFTNAEGLRTTKFFQDLSKVEHFLLWDRAYSREVKGEQKKPDWSSDGLCQYHKKITLGVAKFSGSKFLGFRNDFQKEYYGEESE